MISLHVVSAASSLPRGAFLRQSVHSVSTLLHEIHSDPTVRSRYARLFNTRPESVDLVFAGLHLAEFTRAGHFDICFVRPNGHFGFSLQKVHRGMLIFADRRGIPVLMQVCGNPIKIGWPKEFDAPYSSTPHGDLILSQPIVEMLSSDLLPPELRYNRPQETRSLSEVINNLAFMPVEIEKTEPVPLSVPIDKGVQIAGENSTLVGIPNWIYTLIPPFQFLPHVALPTYSHVLSGGVRGTVPIMPILSHNPPAFSPGGPPTVVIPPYNPSVPVGKAPIPDVPEGGSIVISLALTAAGLLLRWKKVKCK